MVAGTGGGQLQWANSQKAESDESWCLVHFLLFIGHIIYHVFIPQQLSMVT